SRLALRDHEIRYGNDEQGSADHRKRQTALEQGGHGHRLKTLLVAGKGLAWRARFRMPDIIPTTQSRSSCGGLVARYRCGDRRSRLHSIRNAMMKPSTSTTMPIVTHSAR